MKQSEKDSGRGFESPLLHQRVFEKVSCAGGALVSTGSRVGKWTTE